MWEIEKVNKWTNSVLHLSLCAAYDYVYDELCFWYQHLLSIGCFKEFPVSPSAIAYSVYIFSTDFFLFIYSFQTVLGLHCCGSLSLVSASRGYLLRCLGIPLLQASLAWASLVALGSQASVVAAHGLKSCSAQALEHRLNSPVGQLSCSVACGILLDQGSNLCLLYWQADSLALRHQGNPRPFFTELCFKVISCSSNSLRKWPIDNSLQQWHIVHMAFLALSVLKSEAYDSWLPQSSTVVLWPLAFGEKQLASRFDLEWRSLGFSVQKSSCCHRSNRHMIVGEDRSHETGGL